MWCDQYFSRQREVDNSSAMFFFFKSRRREGWGGRAPPTMEGTQANTSLEKGGPRALTCSNNCFVFVCLIFCFLMTKKQTDGELHALLKVNRSFAASPASFFFCSSSGVKSVDLYWRRHAKDKRAIYESFVHPRVMSSGTNRLFSLHLLLLLV